MEEEFGDQLIVAEHHISGEYRNAWADARGDFYGVGPIPIVWFDGVYYEWGAQSCLAAADAYRGWINQRLDDTGGVSPVSIEGVHWYYENQIWLTATFRLEDPADIVDAQGFLLVMENDLWFEWETYDHVTRAAYEIPVVLTEPGDQAYVTYTFDVDPEWDLSEIECIAFLQTMGCPPEVYQSARLPLGATGSGVGGPDRTHHLLSAWPNPFSAKFSGGRLAFNLSAVSDGANGLGNGLGNELGIELLDTGGRTLRSLRARRAAPGLWTADWDGRDSAGRQLPAGSYWIRSREARGAGGVHLILVH